VLVATPLSDAPLADNNNYLRTFAGMTAAQFRDVPVRGQPVPLLWLIARHAALRQYASTAYDLLGTAVRPPTSRLEPELIDISPRRRTPRVWDHLALALPDATPVGTYLDQHKLDGPASFVEFWRALGTLAAFATTELDRALRETLDLCSHRLDAWYTSLASRRLDALRQQAGNERTLTLAAYGWVEDVRPQPATTTWGYVHAPSLAHATTAAVLRSGYLTHQASGSGACAIDLSSARVRRAQQLLDGVRAGQPLGTLLGYQFERALHEHELVLDAYISRFRTFAPVTGVAGDAVVDGLSLLEKRDTIPWGDPRQGFPPVGDPTQTALADELRQLTKTLDAIADLMFAESVHQLVGGNPLRAGATVDAIGRGDSPPPVLDVTRTPRRGALITHRLMVLLAEDSTADWPTTPRAQAEPRLNAFAASLFGSPARARARAQVVSPAGAVLSTMDLTLGDLGLAPLDVLALPDRAPGPAGQSELEQRFRRVAWSRRPAGTPEDARIDLLLDRDPAWAPDQLSLDECLTAAATARQLIVKARPATAADFAALDQSADLAIDTDELSRRARQAKDTLTAASAHFHDGTPLDVALDGAARLGVVGVIPALDATSWSAQARRAQADLDARQKSLNGLGTGSGRDYEVARLQAVFGAGFPVVPCLTTAAASSLPSLFGRSATLLQNRPLEAVTWLTRVARVRAGAARLADALLHAEALSAGAQLDLVVAQLPPPTNDVWAGLPLPPNATPTECVSLVALGRPAQARAALLVDEWVDTIPNATVTTGVTFHIDDPRACTPQVILLAVQPDGFPEWTLESVEGTILDAIELTHMRAVDPDALASVGHFVPALLFATNLAVPPDAIATDFTLATPRHRPL
jgi:hypothetical protein